MSGNILDVIKENQEEIKSLLEELITIVKKQERYESKKDYPLILNVSEIAEILRVNKVKVYELTHREDFPSLKLGNRIIVNRDKFFEWLDKESDKWVD